MEELVTCEGSFRALSESPDSGCSCPSETLFNDGIDDPGQFIVSDRKGSIVMFGDVSTAEMLPENVSGDQSTDDRPMPTDLSVDHEAEIYGCGGGSVVTETMMTSTTIDTETPPVIYSTGVGNPSVDELLGNPRGCGWTDCDDVFLSLEGLVNHVHDVHVKLDSSEMYICRWAGCARNGKGFNARYKILIHVRTHTNEKPHGCYLCGKHFSRLENLKIHKRTHTGERPYVCPHDGCGKAYSNSSDRFKHVLTHSIDRPYECKMPGCTKRYTDPSSLRKHTRTHAHQYTGDVVTTTEDASIQNTPISLVLPSGSDNIRLLSDSVPNFTIPEGLICFSKMPQVPYVISGVPTLINNSFYIPSLISSPLPSAITLPMTTNIAVMSSESNIK